jgi:hypothetical protein
MHPLVYVFGSLAIRTSDWQPLTSACSFDDSTFSNSDLGELGVPESTLKSIAGWMSAKMLGRYSLPFSW